MEDLLSAKNNHRWNNDTCINCGLIRKKKPLTMNLRSYGKYLHDYNVNGEWISIRPNCLKK